MRNKKITLSNDEKLGLISSISTMLTAGISIIEIIESLLEDAKGNQKIILEVLKEDLIEGKRIHTTFSKFPSAFDKVTINILKAAEEAGTLDITLKDLKENLKKEIEFNDKVKSALLYPVVIIFAFIIVLLVILTFVIPKIADVFSRLKVNLPITTRVMIFVSNILITYPLPSITFSALFVVSLYYLYKAKKKVLVAFFSTFPIISPLIKEIDLTRFSRSLSLLLASGLPITTALELTQEVVNKKEIAASINHCREAILSGKSLSSGLRDYKKTIPRIMVKIIEAGEKSGTLDKSMEDISQYFDYQVSKSLKTLTSLLEPIMLVFIGGLVGVMVLSIMAPIYNLISQVASTR